MTNRPPPPTHTRSAADGSFTTPPPAAFVGVIGSGLAAAPTTPAGPAGWVRGVAAGVFRGRARARSGAGARAAATAPPSPYTDRVNEWNVSCPAASETVTSTVGASANPAGTSHATLPS